MKNEFLTAIVIAIIAVVGGFLVTNTLMGPVKSVTIKTIEEGVGSELAEPNPEIFNYRALNPTVEVYVGDCVEYNEFGDCKEGESQTYVDSSSPEEE